MSQLVVLTGPIASGKSTVARALAERCRDVGRSVAVVDVDDCFFETVYAPREQLGALWSAAHEVHGELVAAWLRTDVDAVIAHGPFLTADENAPLFAALEDATPHLRVHLHATFDVALERVTADDDRGISRDAAFLRATYERHERFAPAMPVSDLDFDSTTMTADEIAVAISARLLPRLT